MVGAIGVDLPSSLDIDDIRAGPFDVTSFGVAVERGIVVTGTSLMWLWIVAVETKGVRKVSIDLFSRI